MFILSSEEWRLFKHWERYCSHGSGAKFGEEEGVHKMCFTWINDVVESGTVCVMLGPSTHGLG